MIYFNKDNENTSFNKKLFIYAIVSHKTYYKFLVDIDLPLSLLCLNDKIRINFLQVTPRLVGKSVLH